MRYFRLIRPASCDFSPELGCFLHRFDDSQRTCRCGKLVVRDPAKRVIDRRAPKFGEAKWGAS